MRAPILYTIIPCYNEEELLEVTISHLNELYDQWIRQNIISEGSRLLYVNDGSTDNTWHIIERFHSICSQVGGVNLSSNVGHQNALLAGLTVAVDKADLMVTIDADLQDDPTVISEMVDEYNKGADIVYGVRKERKKDTFFKRITALGFYKTMDWLGTKTVYNHADFRLMSKRAVNQLLLYRERNLFLRGIVPHLGYHSACVYYNRAERMAGKSKYPINKMVSFAVDGITSFSTKPVHMIIYLGVIFLLISFGILVWVVWSLMSGQVVKGWSSIILSIWFCSGCVLISMGIVGEYIGKIYVEVKDRPRFNIVQTL